MAHSINLHNPKRGASDFVFNRRLLLASPIIPFYLRCSFAVEYSVKFNCYKIQDKNYFLNEEQS